jgi:hypothetical protein
MRQPGLCCLAQALRVYFLGCICRDLQNKWEFPAVSNGGFVPVYYWNFVGTIPIYYASRSMYHN